MKKISKSGMVFYAILGICVSALTAYGMYLILGITFGSTFKENMVIITPLILLLIPLLVYGNYLAYERYYLCKINSVEFTNWKHNIFKPFLISSIIMGVAVLSCIYSYIYLFYEKDYLIGILLAVVAVSGSWLQLHFTGKVVRLLLSFFERWKEIRE